MTKTIKIAPMVHQELKVYVAQKGENITDVAGLAIMKYLSERGHKFIYPKIKSSKK